MSINGSCTSHGHRVSITWCHMPHNLNTLTGLSIGIYTHIMGLTALIVIEFLHTTMQCTCFHFHEPVTLQGKLSSHKEPQKPSEKLSLFLYQNKSPPFSYPYNKINDTRIPYTRTHLNASRSFHREGVFDSEKSWDTKSFNIRRANPFWTSLQNGEWNANQSAASTVNGPLFICLKYCSLYLL